jgi:hypothetical protein
MTHQSTFRGRSAACTSPGRRQLLGTCAASLLASVAAPVAATPSFVIERGGMVALPASPEAQRSLQSFAEAYARAGRPRIALWWNRVLSDRHTDDAREVARVTAEISADGRRASVESSSGRETRTEAERNTRLAERDLFQVETEFTRRLLDAGVRVVDRATLLRLAAANKQAPVQLDRLQLEMQALMGHADYFLEVLLSPDDAAPLGFGFRTDLKVVQTGQVLGTAYLSAMPELPPPGRGSVVARPGGYELVPAPPPRVTVQAIGDALAMQAMQELSQRLPAAASPR